MKKAVCLLLFLQLLLNTQLQAQLQHPLYLSQFSYGTGWQIPHTTILVGHINSDSVPDVVLTLSEGYQVAYGKLDNGKISFDWLPIDFYREGWYYFDGQLVDYDLDGDEDLITAGSNNFDYVFSFILENEGGHLVDTFRNAAPEFANKARLLFGKYNNDDVNDLYYYITGPPSSSGPNLQDGQTGQLQTLPFDKYGIESDDYNGDGLMDFYQYKSVSPQYQAYTDNLYLNNGDYSFEQYETTGRLSERAFGDFDGDGVKDLYSLIYSGSKTSFVFKTKMKSQNEARLDTLFITQTIGTRSNIVMDVTGDGTDDLIVFTQDSLFFCESDPDMHFNIQRMGGIWHPALVRQHPDLPKGTVVAMTEIGLPLLLEFSYNDSTGLTVKQDYNAFSPFCLTEAIYAAPTTSLDLDADGKPELCIGNEYTVASVEIQSDSTIAERRLYDLFDNNIARNISSGDWNGDGHKDLFINEAGTIYVSTREPNGSLAARQFLANGILLDAHDFDKNGYADLLIANASIVYVGYNENAAFVSQAVLADSTNSPDFTVFDPNADGYLDVALSTYRSRIFMNDGQRHFTETPLVLNTTLAHSTLPNSPYLFTVSAETTPGSFFYHTDLLRISPDGADAEFVAGYVFIDTAVINREAWLVNYDGDSIPDMLFNFMDNVNIPSSKAILVDNSGCACKVLSFPRTWVLGAEDATGDDLAEIVFVNGAQDFLQIGALPKTTSGISETPQPRLDLKIYPNPAQRDADWTIEYENDFQGQVLIEIFDLNGRIVGRYEQEKSAQRFVSILKNPKGSAGAVLMRVTDGTGTAVRKVVLMGAH